ATGSGSNTVTIGDSNITNTYLKGAVSLSSITATGTALTDQPTLGTEFLSGSGWTSTDWTGTWAAGWAHTTGNTSVLSFPTAAVVSTRYQIAYTVTGRTAGTFTLAFGGQSVASVSATGTFGPTATTTGNLTVTPTSTFDGTIVISIKAITAASSSIITLNTSAAANAVQMRASSASISTFVGVNAGAFVTTGTGNSAFGVNSLFSTTTGSNNTASGISSLSSNTTGGSNTASGANALYTNTTGGNNSAFGVNSLLNNTTASNNSAFGLSALQASTTGGNNSAFGVNAMLSNTTGSSNAAFGLSALQNNTGGTNNTASGSSAMQSNTTGNSNTAVGVSSLQNNTSGINNSVVGLNAMLANVSGSNNVAIGVTAGRYIADGSTSNTTSSSSIYLGYQTKAGASGNTNENVIGTNATGRGSNTTAIGDASITDTYLRGRISSTGLHNPGTLPTGTTDQFITSGTYTPTLTSIANITDATVVGAFIWSRTGNEVSGAGLLTIDPILPTILTQLGLSVPIPSNFVSTSNGGGVAAATDLSDYPAGIFSDAANDRLTISWVPSDASNRTMSVHFKYVVL
ncbi:MAG TPA: hypothetical protein VN843_08370, partial [Anaerolineales bacterium]|nr:hypothetical protein [Anaerolineales bacterium]